MVPPKLDSQIYGDFSKIECISASSWQAFGKPWSVYSGPLTYGNYYIKFATFLNPPYTDQEYNDERPTSYKPY